MSLSSARFCLQPYDGPKSRYTCPGCEKRRVFTRWMDTATKELLPDEFGICDRADKCGYSQSPYTQAPNGLSYAQEVRQGEKEDATTRPARTPKPKPAITLPLCTIPEEVLQKSLGQYHLNQFALLLRNHFGLGIANDLLRRFEVGTSAHWPGATTFWQRDVQGRVRGGQVVLFDAEGHTAKIIGREDELIRCTTWVHTALKARYRKHNQKLPLWLSDYLNPTIRVEKSPALYGLAQLMNEPDDRPVAIVEAPKTAIICTPYFRNSTWLAVGALSYLNAERLLSVKHRPIILYPDASLNGTAYRNWCDKAAALRKEGFQINVSDFLETRTSSDQKAAGIDLADLLLELWAGYPPSWDDQQ